MDGGDASYSLFCPFRAGVCTQPTQGAALGYGLSGLSGRIRRAGVCTHAYPRRCPGLVAHCPFRARCALSLPRALPWAMGFLAFQAVFAGRGCALMPTQGAALGWQLIALSGCSLQNLRNLNSTILGLTEGRPIQKSHPMGHRERAALFKCPTRWDKKKGPAYLNVPPGGTNLQGRCITDPLHTFFRDLHTF